MVDNNSFWRNHLKNNPPVLDAGTRIWEIVCGLVMVLTFTGSISAATTGNDDVKLILWAALGCNTAWGIVDALMYLMSVWLDRENGVKALRRIRNEQPADGRLVIKEYLPPIASLVMPEDHVEELRKGLIQLPAPPFRAFLTWHDVRNALLVFLLVFLSTFPVVIPFLLKIEIWRAMRISNGIVLLLLFASGLYLGGQSGYRRIIVGLLLAFIGALLVGITMALGG